jgi:hypothetical protein
MMKEAVLLSIVSKVDVAILFIYWPGKDIVFRFIIEYSSLRNFGP